MDTVVAAINAVTAFHGPVCALGYVTIPDSSLDGITGIDLGLSAAATYFNRYCGLVLGPALAVTSTAMTCKLVFIKIGDCLHSILVAARTPFGLGVWTAAAAQSSVANTGFNLDYTQVAAGQSKVLIFRY